MSGDGFKYVVLGNVEALGLDDQRLDLPTQQVVACTQRGVA